MKNQIRNNDAYQVASQTPVSSDGSNDIFNRAVHSLVLGFFAWLALWVFAVLTVVQWGFLVFTGAANTHLKAFLSNVVLYVSQNLRYLAFASDHKPFPFASWPQGAPKDSGEGESSA